MRLHILRLRKPGVHFKIDASLVLMCRGSPNLGQFSQPRRRASMNIFSGILSSITNFFSDNSATTDATPMWTSSDDIARADDVSPSTTHVGGSTVCRHALN